MRGIKAFMMGQATKDNERRVFDWNKAARIIGKRGVTEAHAGLEGDWGSTGGIILEDGIPQGKTSACLASTWAVPVLCLEDEVIPCWVMESETDGWNDNTCWPSSALAILAEFD